MYVQTNSVFHIMSRVLQIFKEHVKKYTTKIKPLKFDYKLHSHINGISLTSRMSEICEIKLHVVVSQTKCMFLRLFHSE